MLTLYLMSNKNGKSWYCTAQNEDNAKHISYVFGLVTKPENARIMADSTAEMIRRLGRFKERPSLMALLDRSEGTIVCSNISNSLYLWGPANLRKFPSRDQIRMRVTVGVGYNDEKWAKCTYVIAILNKDMYNHAKIRSAVKKKLNDSRIVFIHIFEWTTKVD